jgi:putative alpha-1,2-mannosidase
MCTADAVQVQPEFLLVQLMGGSNAYCAKLDSGFKLAAPKSFVFGYSGGTASYANQPGCSNAHLFNYAINGTKK